MRLAEQQPRKNNMAENSDAAVKILEDAELLWHGDFALVSGEHSNAYWQKSLGALHSGGLQR